MSAYIVDKAHIDALVQAGLLAARRDRSPSFRWGAWPDPDNYTQWELNDGNANEIGARLWLENAASVAARYPNDAEGEWPGPAGLTLAEIGAYEFEPLAEPLTFAELIDAISGYEYQSCEHRGWRAPDNYARAFTSALRDRTARSMADLENERAGRPGMWSVPEERERKQILRRV